MVLISKSNKKLLFKLENFNHVITILICPIIILQGFKISFRILVKIIYFCKVTKILKKFFFNDAKLIISTLHFQGLVFYEKKRNHFVKIN